MIIRLTPKRATFSASHHLMNFGPQHKCARDHGHTWWVQATFEGEPDEDGILIDYAIVETVTRPLDHRCLDEIFDGKATGENILAWIVGLLQACAADRHSCRVIRVELVEDPIPGDAHTLVWYPEDGRIRGTSRSVPGGTVVL